MSCPTCASTLEGIGHGMFHCPRCGTVTGVYADGSACVPALVGRCRKFAESGLTPSQEAEWHILGIAEAINVPERGSHERLARRGEYA